MITLPRLAKYFQRAEADPDAADRRVLAAHAAQTGVHYVQKN
ncbi:MAG: hypothetical protein QOJ54_406 [Aliidongia sp.]|jgi:hypothetical protein|nr:hypothetical protein [Aliidongia sp.]